MRGTREDEWGVSCREVSFGALLALFRAGGYHIRWAHLVPTGWRGRFGVGKSDDDHIMALVNVKILTSLEYCRCSTSALCVSTPLPLRQLQRACVGGDISNLRREHQK